jgi:hypothetical protein
MPKIITDLHALPEDERINLIGAQAIAGHVVGVLLEKDQPEKVARYIEKVTTRYPGVRVVAQVDGPTPATVTVKFGPPRQRPPAPGLN